MNLEMKDALSLLKSWQDSSAHVRVALVASGKPLNFLCRIAAVHDFSVVFSSIGQAHTFSVSRFDDADFEVNEPPTILEGTWSDGESCRFEIVAR
jgi:hypothetical protein